MIRDIILFFAFASCALGQAAPSISNVTNAAIPSLDYPPASIHLAPRSMATIFGANLADLTVSTTSPGSSLLGGTAVHLADDTCFDSSCDLIASLIYVSPTQINFLVPDNGSASCKNCTPIGYRVVLVRDGQRIDDESYMLGGPGRVFVDAFDIADYNVVFQVGYDCLFSYSLSDPASCGQSWSQGQDRAPAGAITDAVSGKLINSQAPIHQGQAITFWMTGMYGDVALNNATGLMQQASPAPIGFGVAQLGKDIPATIDNGFYGPFGTFMSPTPIWSGESPQFIGLDQVNVAFPTCANPPSAAEKRYDAFLMYTSIETLTTVRIYLPFVVRPGDPDCQWTINSSTSTTSSPSPSAVGQSVTFTAAVFPSAASGAVTFIDGTTPFGSGNLFGGTATLSTSALSTGTHSISAVYSGDSVYNSSSSAVLLQTVNNKAESTTTVSSTPVPGGVILTAIVSPSTAGGTVTFFDNGGLIGSVNLNLQPTCVGGQCVEIAVTLNSGSQTITANYSGNSSYVGSSSLPIIVNGTSTILTSSSNPSTAGQAITFTATVSPSNATGMVGLFDGLWSLACGSSTPCPLPILCSGGQVLSSFGNPYGQVKCVANLPPGNHLVTAVYSGDNSYDGASATVTQTVH